MYTPTSLSRALSRSKHVKGVPPDSVASGGVACLSSGDMQRLRLRVLDVVMLSTAGRTSFAVAWPLVTVPNSFVALDDASLASLGVTAAEIPRSSAASTPSKHKRSRRKSTGAASKGNGDSRESPRTPRDGRRKAHNTRAANTEAPIFRQENPRDMHERRREDYVGRDVSVEHEISEPKQLLDIRVLSHGQTVLEATGIDACSEVDFLWSEECIAMVHRVLIGRILSPGMLIPISLLGKHVRLKIKNVRHSPQLDSASGDLSEGTLKFSFVKYVSSSKLTVIPEQPKCSITEPGRSKLSDSIGGLDRQLREVLDLAQMAFREETHGNEDEHPADDTLSRGYRSRGVLLHGPPGSGKTLLACAISEACSAEIEIICGPEVLSKFSGDAVKAIQASFSRARRKQPCVVILDEVDAIAPKRDAAQSDNVQRKLTAALLTLLDGSSSSSDLAGLFMIGTTRHPESIDAAVRRAGRFDREIEITVPDSRDRLQILQVLSRKAAREGRLDMDVEALSKISRICYGFVGADLTALWRESVNAALRRGCDSRVCYNDMLKALKLVKPSALREVVVEIPSTRWVDIGGNDSAKQRLKEAVEWPLTDHGLVLFASLGVSPPSGILLFGPPGCSKTLLARAVATESGANFISIKGAELLSKWVGESEKAVQAIFRRARQAAPCVIFFDEVDALAGSRSATGGAAAQARVVAQLLAEMDGVETVADDPSRRVVVIAATNRPDCLDDAFLRPGRIDVQIYVGLPDEEERLAILKVHTREIPMSEDVNLALMAADRMTGGFSGAEIGALVREAALCAMEGDVENASEVTNSDFTRALHLVTPRTPNSVIHYFTSYVEQIESRQLK